MASQGVPSQPRRPQVDDDGVPSRSKPRQADPPFETNDLTSRPSLARTGMTGVIGAQMMFQRAPGSPTPVRDKIFQNWDNDPCVRD